MANLQIQDLPNTVTIADTDLVVVQIDPAGTPETKNMTYGDFMTPLDPLDTRITALEGLSIPHICEGRLTLTSGVPVTTSDVSSTILYFSPYKGNVISLYDSLSGKWILYTFTERPYAFMGDTIRNKNVDVFVYWTGGALAFDMISWANDTTRSTSLDLQDGVWIKSSAPERRYIGTVRGSGSVANTLEDTVLKRHVWNNYNRVNRTFKLIESTDSWTYSLTPFQQARASSSNQISALFGLVEDPIDLTLIGFAGNSTAPKGFAVAIGEDSTTTPSSDCIGMYAINPVTTWPSPAICKLNHIASSVGMHIYTWLESGSGSGTTTWFGDNGLTIIQSGLSGYMKG